MQADPPATQDIAQPRVTTGLGAVTIFGQAARPQSRALDFK
jgi:hypothetical protein